MYLENDSIQYQNITMLTMVLTKYCKNILRNIVRNLFT